jgi:hypothetical protein
MRIEPLRDQPRSSPSVDTWDGRAPSLAAGFHLIVAEFARIRLPLVFPNSCEFSYGFDRYFADDLSHDIIYCIEIDISEEDPHDIYDARHS